MGKRRKAEAHAGGHGWYVTFADLMALLMAFFLSAVASLYPAYRASKISPMEAIRLP